MKTRESLPALFLAILLACLGGCRGAPTDQEHRVAEWVLESGGIVSIEHQGAIHRIMSLNDLPTGPVVVKTIGWDIYPGDRNTRVTNEQLDQFVTLQGLEELDLWASEIDDAGLVRLNQIQTLVRLELSQTKVTDKGMEGLERLSRLRHLGLVQTLVSPQGVRRLRLRLPNCKITYEKSTRQGGKGG